MIYIIYYKSKFIGYTEDRIMLKNFLKYRKGKYSFKKMKKSKIPKRIIESAEFRNYEMDYYVGYNITTELPLFMYELDVLHDSLYADIFELSESLYSMLLNITYLKLSKDEKRLIEMALTYIVELIDSIAIGHEPIFDEVIDLVQYFNTKK